MRKVASPPMRRCPAADRSRRVLFCVWLDGDRMSEPIGGTIVLVIFMALIAWRAWTDD